MNKSIIILSEKSSGSSACQNFLSKYANIGHVSNTRHFENETLYWTKAASVLGLPQINIPNSEVPLPSDMAKKDIIKLLNENLENFVIPDNDKELIMKGWEGLCNQHSPIFLEKSPHHLCQWSALELMIEFINSQYEVKTMLIGLIRNPMDTIYSHYKRWKTDPSKIEKQWVIAYKNLRKLKETAGINLHIVRYEDMVTSLTYLKPIFEFCEVSSKDADSSYLHVGSIQKWKRDKLFGFTLSNETLELAQSYGYREHELINNSYSLWPLTKSLTRFAYYTLKPIKDMVTHK